jgi:hypothetical protein
MRLKSFSIVFGFNIVSYVLSVSKITNLFLTGKHRPYWKEYFDFIIKGDIRILEFFTCFQETIG